jgi:hypothetical protein
MTMVGLWALAGPALAADLVVYGAGDGAAAVVQVAAHAGLPPDSLRAMSLTELTATRSTLVVGGRAIACAGSPSTNADVKAAAETAAGDVAYMDYEQAKTHADAAATALGCLSEPIDADVAAEVFVQRGLAAFYANDAVGARAAFAQANRLHPGLVWDVRYGAGPKEVFDASLADVSGAAVHVKLVPNPGRVGILIDGRRAVGETYVSPGEHVVQLVGSAPQTVRVVIDPGTDASIMLPRAVGSEAAAWVVDEAGRADLSGALGGMLGAGVTVYVVHGPRTFRVVAGTPESAEITPGAATADTTTANHTTSTTSATATTSTVAANVDTMTVHTDKIVVEEKHSIRALVIPGAILGGVGAVGGVVGFTSALSAKKDANAADDLDEWEKHETRYREFRKLTYVGDGLLGLGAVLAVSGVVFADSHVVIGPRGLVVRGWF